MHYFIRTMEKHKDSEGIFGSEIFCDALPSAKARARHLVMEADPTLMLQADACSRNHMGIRTRYRCWMDERGNFHERSLA